MGDWGVEFGIILSKAYVKLRPWSDLRYIKRLSASSCRELELNAAVDIAAAPDKAPSTPAPTWSPFWPWSWFWSWFWF